MPKMIKCPFCGEVIDAESYRCIFCKENLYEEVKEEIVADVNPAKERKTFLKASLFVSFLGTWGIHRFYTGYIGIGIAQLFTFGGLGLWTLIDLISILFGSYKDVNGNKLYIEKKSKATIVGILSLLSSLFYLMMVYFYVMYPMLRSDDTYSKSALGLFLQVLFGPLLLARIAIVANAGKKFGIIASWLAFIAVIYLVGFALSQGA